MERTMSAEERIRRAEEIYSKRRMQSAVRVPTSHVNAKQKVEYGMFKKLILQIVICLLIYFIFYLLKYSNYIFSEDVLNKTREFLSYDINFQALYEQVENYYQKYIKNFFFLGREENEQQKLIATNEMINEVVNEITNEIINTEEQTNSQIEGGIGGGDEGVSLLSNELVDTSADEEVTTEESIPLSQMEIDANEIKSDYSFILPLKGTVTSRFGSREATEIVSANHAGIDIGVNEGTVFVAAMEGNVTFVSSEGGYGNHVYIQNGDVITIYAHCKTIYVKEGDLVQQGQKIGEVGATGNATGPHLHFEVRKSDRVVNPEYILAFS